MSESSVNLDYILLGIEGMRILWIIKSSNKSPSILDVIPKGFSPIFGDQYGEAAFHSVPPTTSAIFGVRVRFKSVLILSN